VVPSSESNWRSVGLKQRRMCSRRSAFPTIGPGNRIDGNGLPDKSEVNIANPSKGREGPVKRKL